jgi:predicted anti-sigma-YlaC factor YlaD
MTCSQFLEGLNDYLDEEVDAGMRSELECHLSKCSGCRVIWDTTRKTVRVFKVLDPQPIPAYLETRLLRAIALKARAGV